MFKKFLALAAVATMALSFSPAPASAAASSWSATSPVTLLYAGDTVLLQFGSMINPEGCNGGYIKLNTGTPDMNAAYQLLLAAYMSGKSVSYRVNGCNYYAVLYSVRMN